ncbi:hypothetical protein [Escherichia coli]|uniref:hypothetical protein n=1 Tax=Escherichia coli TaxID=562 RepID=UPI003890567E
MLLVLVLIGLNMRPLLTSVGPLLPQLRQASGMSFSVAALLTVCRWSPWAGWRWPEAGFISMSANVAVSPSVCC